MAMQVASINWAATQEALREAVGRVTALLRSDLDPTRPAVGEWNLGDVAMHLSQAWVIIPCLARNDMSRVYAVLPSLNGIAGENFIRDVWDLGGTTKQGVLADPERNLGTLADRIEQAADEFFAEQAGRPADELCPWLVEGTRLPRPVFTAHLLNETLMHGADIARAAGRPWPISRAHAAMVFSGFIAQILRALPPTAMVEPNRAKDVRAVFQVHLRGNESWIFAFDNGQMRTLYPSELQGKVDCHISADPQAFLDVVYARKSQWAAIAKGELVAWGRKPWLGPRLRMLVRNP